MVNIATKGGIPDIIMSEESSEHLVRVTIGVGNASPRVQVMGLPSGDQAGLPWPS